MCIASWSKWKVEHGLELLQRGVVLDLKFSEVPTFFAYRKVMFHTQTHDWIFGQTHLLSSQMEEIEKFYIIKKLTFPIDEIKFFFLSNEANLLSFFFVSLSHYKSYAVCYHIWERRGEYLHLSGIFQSFFYFLLCFSHQMYKIKFKYFIK